MFSPKWKTEAKHLVKGAHNYLHYKRDLLKDEKIGEIESRRQDLIDAIRSGDRTKVAEASKQLRTQCENALPHEKPCGWLEGNVEVMFVNIVIILGLRAYCLQPFRIPTGSMQPTLNGIIGTPLPQAEWPALPKRIVQKILRGRTYVHLVNDRERQIASTADGQPKVADSQRWHFFSRSVLFFQDDKPMWLPAPRTPCLNIGLRQAILKNHGYLAKGDVLCEGYIDSGDLVLVNKFSYHFRKPKRGEVFVFDTLGIRGIDQRSGDQAKGSHYIKRLCGVPGDTLSIDPPHLLVNGKIAQEPGIQRVMQGKGVYSVIHNGYQFSQPENENFHRSLTNPNDTLPLRADAPHGRREYAALGDNTASSLDSRYWGEVKEFNLVGPALFTLWPISQGHWGLID